ncbi:uncharacterized protein [Misgurnus anguillicaudatus]|uniref:uncharacterized protein n=1 Tax=Misgurnus anguillicaudatus TaxID=75329 RepID=UPI003CCF2FE3
MNDLIIFFIFSLFTNGVFGDEVKSASVLEGDSVTLHTDITEIHRDDLIEWTFGSTPIASINREANAIRTKSDRLQINNQTGDLTIRNTRPEDSGMYEVDITGMRTSFKKLFNVSCVSDSSSDGVKSVSVMNRDSVILHTSVTKIKSDDLIEWRFGPQLSLIASCNKTSHWCNAVGGIEDRLHLNHRNGDLTIRHIRHDTSGLYEVQIRGGKSYTITKSFNVTIIDGLKTMSVKEGLSVTLWSGVAEIHRADVILWWFEHGDSPIAKIDRKAQIFETYDGDDGRFKDILTIDLQSGNLTIRNIKTNHSGLYHVDSSSSTHTLFTRFSLTVCEHDLFSVAGVGLYLLIAVAAVAVVAVAAAVAGLCYYRRRSYQFQRCQEKNSKPKRTQSI